MAQMNIEPISPTKAYWRLFAGMGCPSSNGEISMSIGRPDMLRRSQRRLVDCLWAVTYCRFCLKNLFTSAATLRSSNSSGQLPRDRSGSPPADARGLRLAETPACSPRKLTWRAPSEGPHLAITSEKGACAGFGSGRVGLTNPGRPRRDRRAASSRACQYSGGISPPGPGVRAGGSFPRTAPAAGLRGVGTKAPQSS